MPQLMVPQRVRPLLCSRLLQACCGWPCKHADEHGEVEGLPPFEKFTEGEREISVAVL
jgi:hypothetical protein